MPLGWAEAAKEYERMKSLDKTLDPTLEIETLKTKSMSLQDIVTGMQERINFLEKEMKKLADRLYRQEIEQNRERG